MTDAIEGVRLSPQQRRLWLLQEVHGPLTVRIVADLQGPLDRDALHRSIAKAVARHDILRTSLQSIRGMKLPVQVVAPPGPLSHPLPPTGRGGTLRVEMETLGPDRHRLTLSLPALYGDLQTLRLVLREIAGQPASEEPLQYWQYSEWLNDLLEDEASSEGRAFWERRLPESQEPRLPFESEGPGSATLELDPLRGLNVPAALLAAWSLLLRRHLGEEVAVGAVLDGREFEELSGSLGPFTRALPLRLRTSLDAPFADHLVDAGEALAELADRQRFFTWPAPTPFPFLFEHRTAPPVLEAGGYALTVLAEQAPCDASRLSLLCIESPDRLILHLSSEGGRVLEGARPGGPKSAQDPASSDTLGSDPEAARASPLQDPAGAFLARFATLLAQGVSHPELPAGDLDLLTEEDRRRLDPGAAPICDPPCVHHLFEAQAARTPDADALRFGSRRLSYSALNAHASHLARRLRSLGVEPDVRVGLCVDPGPEALVGILGIWKAGGAYVPVDPHGPAERRAFFLSDSGARVLVTQSSLVSTVSFFSGETLAIDLIPLGEAVRPTPEDGGAQPGNLAYVLYTSGSTGVPKGVGVEHRQLAHYLSYVDRVLFGDAIRICPLITPLTFDACLKQALAPLLRGDTVWGFEGESALDPPALLAELTRLDALGINCTPTFWRAVLEEIERSSPSMPGLRRILLGGERLTPDLLARTAAALPAAEVWNLYGPTETTANAAVACLSPGEPVSLGWPIDGAWIVLLDPRMQPVPPGVTGEVHVGGVGVARGYLDRPGLTAERFAPDPFSGCPGSRLYRTGDLGRLTADGRIELLGRIDHQVKIRGYRIELGEIEARLEQRPEVREAAVLAQEEGAGGIGGDTGSVGGMRLVAWVVPERGGLEVSELRASLREALPEYMIPAAFVVLDRLPRLPSGKVDRRALPASGEALAPERTFVAPRTPTEQRLAEIWAEALGRERVSVEDNFFELGGHSIQSIQISHRATAAGFAITPRDLLHCPTVAGLAALLEAVEWEEGSL